MSTTTIPLAKIDTNSAAYRKVHAQAKQFEGVFLNTLMKEMFSSIKSDDKNFGGGFGEETWRGLQSEQFSQIIADKGGVGLADQLMPTLLRLQEASANPSGARP